MKKVFVFQKICFKVEVLKMFFRRAYAISVGLGMKALGGGGCFRVLGQGSAQVLGGGGAAGGGGPGRPCFSGSFKGVSGGV